MIIDHPIVEMENAPYIRCNKCGRYIKWIMRVGDMDFFYCKNEKCDLYKVVVIG